ncbi:MAG TPA: ACP S-malonyltransferase [Jatrophihabitans sp.]|jgi:[acyl-carrier-protein] S-malonyltransferase|uniref:ACP S-malonyltransferase n=1 Tax=Jatrophihabitans sp. TaxID=1932789 RepID=UPI002EE243E2
MAKTAFLFPGQGTQKPGMGVFLVERYPRLVKALFDEADDILGFPLSDFCANGPPERLREMPITQPAVFMVSHAAACALAAEGVQADVAVGHSLGEYAAFTYAGVLDWRDTLRLVHHRGLLMASVHARTDGKMAALLGCPLIEVEQLCAQVVNECGLVVEVANHNEPDQVVVSGQSAGVDRLLELVTAAGAERVTTLRIGGPAHSSLMSDVAGPFAEFMQSLPFRDPTVELLSSATAGPLRTGAEVRQVLSSQLVQRVRWVETMQALVTVGVGVGVEVGPGKVLSSLVARNQPAIQVYRTNDDLTFSTAVKGARHDQP